MQICPWCRNEPQAPAEAALATSASAITIRAELPPSSRWQRLRWAAASWPTCLPTAVEPVNEITRTSGSVISASPAVGTAGQHVQQALGQPGLLEHPGQRHAAADRGARVRLEHHRVAQRQRGRHRADRQDLREVERRDHADHADRDPLGETEVRRFAGQQLTVGARGQRGRLVHLLGGDVRLELSGRGDLAALPDVPLLDLLGVGPPDVAGPAQQRGPLGVRGRGPGGLGGRRRGGRGGHVGGRRDAGPAQFRAGGRLGDRSLPAGGGLPAAREDLAPPG